MQSILLIKISRYASAPRQVILSCDLCGNVFDCAVAVLAELGLCLGGIVVVVVVIEIEILILGQHGEGPALSCCAAGFMWWLGGRRYWEGS